MAELHRIFYACRPWPWLGPPPTALQYVMYFRFLNDVMFSYHGTK